MFEKLREIRERVKTWWDSLDEQEAESGSKVLAFFRPADPAEIPRPLRQLAAVGSVAALLAFGGVALVCLSGLLISLFVIYFLATEVLGLDLEIDPRLWQAM